MKKTKIISLTLSLALILTALLSVNMTSASAEGVTNGYFRYNIRTYDFDTNTPSMVLDPNANVNYTVLNPNNTTKAVRIASSASNNYSQGCAYIYIDTTDAESIDYKIGTYRQTNTFRVKQGVYSGGNKYWVNLLSTNSDFASWPASGALGKYVLTSYSGYKNGLNFGVSYSNATRESVMLNSISALLFKPLDNRGYIIIDDINVCKHVYLNSASMVKGASIRLGTDNGIRFISSFDSTIMEEIAALEANGYTVNYGTLIAPSDLLGEDELTFDLDSSKYIDVPTSGYFNNETGVIAGSIKVNLSKNVAREFVGRGYVKVYNKDGKLVFTNYASANDNARSLKTLSNSWINDTDSYALLNEAQQDTITSWANA